MNEIKKHNANIKTIDSVAAYHDLYQMPKPLHPLMSIVDFSETSYFHPEGEVAILFNLYCISIKEDSSCILRYGPTQYDFREGGMAFIRPGQLLSVDAQYEPVKKGFILLFHPDFIRSFPLMQKIQQAAYFDYAVNEVLFVSDKKKITSTFGCQALKKNIPTILISLASRPSLHLLT